MMHDYGIISTRACSWPTNRYIPESERGTDAGQLATAPQLSLSLPPFTRVTGVACILS